MRLTHATLVWFVFVFCATGLLAQMGGSGVASRMPYFKTLHSFGGTDGVYSSAALVQATDGNLYGTTANGGANGDGTIFRITPSGTLTTIYSFCSQPGCADGLEPYGVLIQATTGDLYGTTSHGGTANSGTVFRITPSGTLTTLYTFCSQSNCVDGANPYGGLVQAIDGNLYGTTSHGGTLGVGTVFKITPSGTLTMLYSFCSQNNCMDGIQPYAALVQATDGNFYGTTFYGGDAFFMTAPSSRSLQMAR